MFFLDPDDASLVYTDNELEPSSEKGKIRVGTYGRGLKTSDFTWIYHIQLFLDEEIRRIVCVFFTFGRVMFCV